MITYYDNGPFLQQFSAQADAVAEAKKDNLHLTVLLLLAVAGGTILMLQWQQHQEKISGPLRRKEDKG